MEELAAGPLCPLDATVGAGSQGAGSPVGESEPSIGMVQAWVGQNVTFLTLP